MDATHFAGVNLQIVSYPNIFKVMTFPPEAAASTAFKECHES